MKITERKVYRCEFCKYYRLTKNSTEKHELHCTNNPNRECGMCGRKGLYDYGIKKITEQSTGDGSYSWIEITANNSDIDKAVADDCPVCMLAYLRQNKCYAEPNGWDYKKAIQEYFEAKREDEVSFYA